MFHAYGLDERLPALEDLMLDTFLHPTYADLAHLDTLVTMVRADPATNGREGCGNQ